MKTTKLFFRTLKQAPADSEVISHQLLERGGYLQKINKGLYIYTPLLLRVLYKLMAIVREELNKVGCQELSAPFLQPKKYWDETGRWDDFASANLLYTLKDREGNEFCLAPTAEEIVTFLAGQWVTSYKKLPFNLYQIGAKFRDEIRPRFGLMRGKEFIMKDGYAFTKSVEEMNEQYELMRKAYSAIFKRLELDFAIVTAHGGKIGTGKSEEFQVKADIGEDLIMVAGNFACNIEAANAIVPPFYYEEKEKVREKIHTPGIKTIKELAAFTKHEPQQILKTVVYKLVYSDRNDFVTICIRGDREVNPTKVATKFKALEIELASSEDIEKLGSAAGFIGPFGTTIPVYADLTCKPMTNFICAFNEKDWHYKNCNFDNDLTVKGFDDFLLAQENDLCPEAGNLPYRMMRGIEVGHIFNLGTRYSEKLKATFQNEAGQIEPFWMGTYGIGIGRTLAACVEQKHDDKGIIWPKALAPYSILVTAATPNQEQILAAESLYNQLLEAGFEPLLDDRDERLGFKLKDSDLIGIPYKLIIGKEYSAKGMLELESRLGQKQTLSERDLLTWAKQNLL